MEFVANPALHLVHAVLPWLEAYMPLTHAKQVVEEEALLKDPGGQLVQPDFPDATLYCPGKQATQVVAAVVLL